MSGQPIGHGRFLGGRPGGRRAILVAIVSTTAVFGLLGAIVFNARAGPWFVRRS
ncbi:MAG TPA: hypothetical protein VEO91_02410 [Candidatus Limnocylindria bacterium]|nr:hypothetical protein [Candidatus Limnocylindria bacterium]